MKEKEDMRDKSEYVQKRKRNPKKYLRKGKTCSMLWRWEPCLSIYLKNMNMQLSKACKIEMLKKKQNNNSIFLKFYQFGQFSLENNDSHKVTYMYCSLGHVH